MSQSDLDRYLLRQQLRRYRGFLRDAHGLPKAEEYRALARETIAALRALAEAA